MARYKERFVKGHRVWTMCVQCQEELYADTPAFPSEWKGDIYCIGCGETTLDAAGKCKGGCKSSWHTPRIVKWYQRLWWGLNS